MSMYTTVKTWDEMIKELQVLEPPYCLSVNYDPDNDEYKMWCGSQPYYFYDNEIEKLEDKVHKLEKENKRLSNIVDEENDELTPYRKLVSACKYLLRKGWTDQAVYDCFDKNEKWAPDSITYAIDEAKEQIGGNKNMGKVIISKELADELVTIQKVGRKKPSQIIRDKESGRTYNDAYGTINKASAKLIRDALLFGYTIYEEKPIGIVPREIWERKRMHELLEAIKRYRDADQEVPEEWIEEYNELVMKYTKGDSK